MWNKIILLLNTVLRHMYNNNKISLFEYNLLEQWLNKYIETFLKRLRNNGKKWTLDRYKSINHVAKSLSCRTPFEPITWTKSNDSGIPKELNPVKSLLMGSNPVVKRIILTVTRIFESIYLKPILDEESICSPYNGAISLKSWSENFTKFLNEMGHSRLPSLKHFKPLTKLLCRAKSGPNGPSVATSHLDAEFYGKNKESYETLTKFNQFLGQSWINESLDFCISTYKTSKPICNGTIGISAEPGGKTRLFAIGDYWRQTSLKSLHDYLMRCLKHNSLTDGTYEQNSAFQRILSVKSKYMFSFDLSKATDRVPLYCQNILITHIFTDQIADIWTTLMVSDPFIHRKSNKQLVWAVGQPLGLLSSWPAFSLLHHYLVWYCAWQENLDPKTFNQYQILGDDIVIWNEMVAKRYKSLLWALGVNINESKSFISKEYNNSFEFAKRNAVNNQEVTGISFLILKNATRSIYNLVDLYKYMIDTNWPLNLELSLVPSYLSQSGKNLFEILLWEMSGMECPPSRIDFGNSIIPTLSQIHANMLENRIKSLFQLIEQLDTLLGGKEITEYFTKGGIDWQPRLFSSNNLHHPIVWAINQQGEALYEVLGKTMEADPNDPSTWPELEEVEYLPLPNKPLYFKPKRGNPIFRKKHSQFVLEAYYKSIKLT